MTPDNPARNICNPSGDEADGQKSHLLLEVEGLNTRYVEVSLEENSSRDKLMGCILGELLAGIFPQAKVLRTRDDAKMRVNTPIAASMTVSCQRYSMPIPLTTMPRTMRK